MRVLEKGLFVLGVVSFLVSAAVAGGLLGDILWRAGIAIMLTDLLLVQLWPVQRGAGSEQHQKMAAGG
jgi:hypothetical protein